uniref:Uncharacterized protein n=1 Tax=Pithovirus LCPAC406 TaxID=2506599 RepID=A0A481ZDV0_9VIRU|nr:MAG: hypothetical protein LCPAC406_03920 [Pithovirus LCPAC406]
MAVYQVYNDNAMGFTTDFNQAKEFLEELDHKDGSSGNIDLLEYDYNTGEFGMTSFTRLNGKPLRNLTYVESHMLPFKLYILCLNRTGDEGIDYRVFKNEKSMLKHFRIYHSNYSKIFWPLGKYEDNFAAYMLFEEVVDDRINMSFKEAVSTARNVTDYFEEIDIGKITYFNMKNIGEVYFSRIKERKLRSVFEFAKQYNKLIRNYKF